MKMMSLIYFHFPQFLYIHCRHRFSKIILLLQRRIRNKKIAHLHKKILVSIRFLYIYQYFHRQFYFRCATRNLKGAPCVGDGSSDRLGPQRIQKLLKIKKINDNCIHRIRSRSLLRIIFSSFSFSPIGGRGGRPSGSAPVFCIDFVTFMLVFLLT